MKVFLMFLMLAAGVFISTMLILTGFDLLFKSIKKRGLISFKSRLVVSGLLMALTITVMLILAYRPQPLNQTNKGVQARNEMKDIAHALELYFKDCGSYPMQLSTLLSPTEGDCKYKREEPYLLRLQSDPWGNPYKYNSDEKSFEILSYGFDGKPGGMGREADVIIRR